MKAEFLCYTQKSSQHSSKGLPSPKTNTAAEKRPGPKRKIDKIVSNHHLLGAMLVSGSVYFLLLDKCSSLCLVHFGAASKIPLGQHTTHTHTHTYIDHKWDHDDGGVYTKHPLQTNLSFKPFGFFQFHDLDLFARCSEKVPKTFSPTWWDFNGDLDTMVQRKKSPKSQIQDEYPLAN